MRRRTDKSNHKDPARRNKGPKQVRARMLHRNNPMVETGRVKRIKTRIIREGTHKAKRLGILQMRPMEVLTSRTKVRQKAPSKDDGVLENKLRIPLQTRKIIKISSPRDEATATRIDNEAIDRIMRTLCILPIGPWKNVLPDTMPKIWIWLGEPFVSCLPEMPWLFCRAIEDPYQWMSCLKAHWNEIDP